jgi:drug/metabolite transporter (DMT)-like permease
VALRVPSLALTTPQWLTLIYLGVGASGVGFFLWNVGATKVAPATLAVMNNAKVPLGVAASIVVFGETADLTGLFAGFALLGAALWVAARSERGA